jgi:hypothetical protein
MNNTPLIAYMKNDLAHGILQNTPIRVLIARKWKEGSGQLWVKEE